MTPRDRLLEQHDAASEAILAEAQRPDAIDDVAERTTQPAAKKKKRGPRRMDGEALDLATAAKVIGVSVRTVRNRCDRGELPHHRWAGRVIVLRSELLEFLSRLDGVGVDAALEHVRNRRGDR